MYCSGCGTAATPTDLACRKCGARLPDRQVAEAPASPPTLRSTAERNLAVEANVHAIGLTMLIASVFIFVPQLAQFVRLGGEKRPIEVHVEGGFGVQGALGLTILVLAFLVRRFVGAARSITIVLLSVLIFVGLFLASGLRAVPKTANFPSRTAVVLLVAFLAFVVGYLARPGLRRYFTTEYRGLIRAHPDVRPAVLEEPLLLAADNRHCVGALVGGPECLHSP